MKMTMKEFKAAALLHSCTFRKTEHGEYRVNLIGMPESHAYYSDDPADALNTAIAMYRMYRQSKTAISY